MYGEDVYFLLLEKQKKDDKNPHLIHQSKISSDIFKPDSRSKQFRFVGTRLVQIFVHLRKNVFRLASHVIRRPIDLAGKIDDAIMDDCLAHRR
jgi:hypothetical protein